MNIAIIHSSSDGVTVKIDFPEYKTISVNSNGDTLFRLEMKNAFPILENGSPELLTSAFSLIVPKNSLPTAKIIDSDFSIIEDIDLAPSKGKLFRDVNPDSVAYLKGASYFSDQFLKDQEVSISDPYILRDFTGIVVKIFPFAYNPVRKKLKVFSSITIKIDFHCKQSIETPDAISKTFNQIYTEHFINYASVKDNSSEELDNVLILAPDSFVNALQPYVNWKIMTGYPTEVVPLSIAGDNCESIKDYISNYYNTHHVSYAILVGDYAQFPVIRAGGYVSDNYYGEIIGNDNYPDIIIGKISAETAEQVSIQVGKFIQYEQNPIATDHFPVFCGIASAQGPGDNNEYDYTHIQLIDSLLNTFSYTSGYEFFNGFRGGLDDPGDPTPPQISAAISSGVGLINYCGHGSSTSWSTSGFNANDIPYLTNYNKLPIIISTACLNGDYVNQTCFAESWLRANKFGEHIGAVSTLMSVITQPWNSPMCAQDEMMRLLTHIEETNSPKTFGCIVYNGFFKMLDVYNDYLVSRTWILFGDPILTVRTSVPLPLTVAHNTQIPYHLQDIYFSSSTSEAQIILTHDNHIIGQSTTSNGITTIPMPSTISIYDTIYITALAPNHIPYQGYCVVVPANGPYPICQNIQFHDNRNHDGQADYGETLSLDVTFKNVGDEITHNTDIRLDSRDPYLTILDDTLNINILEVDSINIFTSAFSIKIADNAPAFHTATIYFHAIIDGFECVSYDSILIHAPAFKLQELQVNDTLLGNHNHRMDLQETAILQTFITNEGNCDASLGSVLISCPTSVIQLSDNFQNFPALPIGSQISLQFAITTQVNSPTLTSIHFEFQTSDGYTESDNLSLHIGSMIEDWESVEFSSFAWNNDTLNPWVITSEFPYEGAFAARSGEISNNCSSTLTCTHSNTIEDNISFFFKVSSEQDFDLLSFYIDNEIISTWSGTIDWTPFSIPVHAGTHTYKWEYSKDLMFSDGDDMAMIDFISFPCIENQTGMENLISEKVRVFPNPASDIVNLIIPESITYKNLTVQLCDVSGRVLQYYPIDSSTPSLSIKQYNNGVYLLKIIDDKSILKTLKLIKQQ